MKIFLLIAALMVAAPAVAQAVDSDGGMVPTDTARFKTRMVDLDQVVHFTAKD